MAVPLVTILVLLLNQVYGDVSQKPCSLATHECFIDPCLLASCDNYPLAQCRDFKCGTDCKAEFWYNGQEVTSICGNAAGSDLFGTIFGTGTKPDGSLGSNTVGDQGCPSGQTTVNCAMRPCSVSHCPGVPSATCRDNYCGGCKAEYFLNGQDVTSQCPLLDGQTISKPTANQCPNGEQLQNCIVRPCAVNSCPTYPLAQCRDNYCGGCKAEFFVGSNDVTILCANPSVTPSASTGPQFAADPTQQGANTVGGSCPSYQVTQCNYSPCRVSTCANYPNAICRDVNCGGCYAKFFYNGQEVTSLCRQQVSRQQPFPWYYFLLGEW